MPVRSWGAPLAMPRGVLLACIHEVIVYLLHAHKYTYIFIFPSVGAGVLPSWAAESVVTGELALETYGKNRTSLSVSVLQTAVLAWCRSVGVVWDRLECWLRRRQLSWSGRLRCRAAAPLAAPSLASSAPGWCVTAASTAGVFGSAGVRHDHLYSHPSPALTGVVLGVAPHNNFLLGQHLLVGWPCV